MIDLIDEKLILLYVILTGVVLFTLSPAVFKMQRTLFMFYLLCSNNIFLTYFQLSNVTLKKLADFVLNEVLKIVLCHFGLPGALLN